MEDVNAPVKVDVSVSGRMARQASSDGQLIKMWIHSKATKTQKAYLREAQLFTKFVAKPLSTVTIGDVQGYIDSLEGKAPATIARSLNAVKSLLTFGHRIGYLAFNVAAPERAPKIKNTTAERILTQMQVQRMITLEQCDRNRAILLILYTGGLRVSELCQLRWRDVQQRDDKAQLTVFGKGGKTRMVLIPPSAWSELESLRGDSGLDEPVFVSKKRGHLTASHVWRLVREAAKRAGIKGDVSPHWLRHCNASHALDRGAPLHLVQQSLGHSSAATTSKYLHARPNDGAGLYLGL